MLTVKAPNIHFTTASDWDEVKLHQFIELDARRTLDEEGNAFYTFRDMLECFSSDVSQLHQLGAAEEAKLIKNLPFLKKRPDFRTLPPPDTIAGVRPPDELGACSLLQKWSVEEVMKEFDEEEKAIDFVSIAPKLLAIYLYPLLTGKLLTQSSQADEIIEQIEELPVTKALPLSAFFLTNWNNLTSTGQTSYVISYPERQEKTSLIRWFRSLRITSSWPFFVVSPKKTE